MRGGEVRLTAAQAAKVYDRAFAGREQELHEGHPSWAAFQRFVKAGHGLAPGHRYATDEERAAMAAAAEAVTLPPEPDQELVDTLSSKHGISQHEARLVIKAMRSENLRVQEGPEGTAEGQQTDARRLERLHELAREGGVATGVY